MIAKNRFQRDKRLVGTRTAALGARRRGVLSRHARVQVRQFRLRTPIPNNQLRSVGKTPDHLPIRVAATSVRRCREPRRSDAPCQPHHHHPAHAMSQSRASAPRCLAAIRSDWVGFKSHEFAEKGRRVDSPPFHYREREQNCQRKIGNNAVDASKSGPAGIIHPITGFENDRTAGNRSSDAFATIRSALPPILHD